jgi:hypothetical protein
MFETVGHSDDSATLLFSSAVGSYYLDGKRFAMKASYHESFSSGTQSGNCTAILADDIDFFTQVFKFLV